MPDRCPFSLPSLINMSDAADILAKHYQKTFELTYEIWKQRNRTFLVLVAVIGAGTLLTFRAAQANPLLVYWIAKLLGLTDKDSIAALGKSFPFGLLQSLLFIVVFYLMVNLYHRALYVLRNYRYLAALEREIRGRLGLEAASFSFTRESSFYWSDRPPLLGAVKWFYIVLVGALLLSFLGGRIYADFRARNHVLAFVELAISIPTIMFFVAYARSSVSMDTTEEISRSPEQPARVTARREGA